MLSRGVQFLLQRYWRMSRGLTLGAQGIVIDEAGHVLLVRHGYRPGWHFPGGGVERGESIATALERELEEETGVTVTGPTELYGVFTNFEKFPGDHITVFLVRNWERPKIPAPNAEIRETAFFSPDALPDDTASGTRNRLVEIFSGQEMTQTW
ncbi:MAG: NUDIX domain-containing protein [Pseudomonadota bacterium]